MGPLKTLEENTFRLFQLLESSGVPWFVTASLQPLLVFTWPSFSCVSVSSNHVYVSVYMCIRVCAGKRIRVCRYAYMSLCVCLCACVYTCVCMTMCTCECVYVHVYMHMCVCALCV